MFAVYSSNQPEWLAERLALLLQTPLSTPLAPETIVVPNRDVGRWLSLIGATRLGICANVRFMQPADFIWAVFRYVLPELPTVSFAEPVTLTWRILAALDTLIERPAFAPVRACLAEGSDLQRFELAARLAEIFQQYLVLRPDWVARWEGRRAPAPEDQHWQAMLWRRLAASPDMMHEGRAYSRFSAALGTVSPQVLPERVICFGLATLAPSRLEALARLAEFTDVHLFVVNPSSEYWGDIVSPRGIVRRARTRATQRRTGEVLHTGETLGTGETPPAGTLESGNRLLAAWGMARRRLIDRLQDYPAIEETQFVWPGEDCLLHSLQTDICLLTDRGCATSAKTPVARADCSLQVHVCHSPMREVEILYDQLLALFEAHPDLSASDVAIMAPDIETYAPYIEAVFTARAHPRLPFTIADRRLTRASAIVEVFFALLDLAEGRLAAPQVMRLLEAPAVQRRFDLTDADLVQIRLWLEASNIRWGIDAAGRAALGLPATSEHTWRTGLDRLLLGYAMPAEGGRSVAGLMPCEAAEGIEARLLGRLHDVVEALFALHEALVHSRPLAAWATLLGETLEQFIAPLDVEESEAQAIRQTLSLMATTALETGFAEPVALAVARAFLHRYLDEISNDMPARAGRCAPASRPSQLGSLLTGRVNVCTLSAQRCIPFAIICLIGMNDGSFPRLSRPFGFDLMAREDSGESQRHSERTLFLDTLLLARRCLYLSYVGQDDHATAERPPSVLVSELLEEITRGFTAEDGTDICAQLITHHPLQPFSARYFDGQSRLFSYSSVWCEAARARDGPRTAPRLLVGDHLPPPPVSFRTVTLDDLGAFFVNPARFFLKRRLGITLEDDADALSATEPFMLDALARYQVRQQLLAAHWAGGFVDEVGTVLDGYGMLPHGALGRACLKVECDVVTRFTRRLPALDVSDDQPLEVDIELAGLRLVGRVSILKETGLLNYRLGRLRPQDRLTLWLLHLALHVMHPSVSHVSRFVAERETLTLTPVAGARAHLETLLRLYWVGLERVLPFFIESAYVLVEAERQGQEGWRQARRCWQGSEYNPGEGENPYIRLAFGQTDPLDEAFGDCARGIFGPLLEHAVAGGNVIGGDNVIAGSVQRNADAAQRKS